MMIYKVLIILAIAEMSTVAVAKSNWTWQKNPVVFYDGHTHDKDGRAVNAPEHSGGLDAYGCHNASVPYHCHR